MPELIWKAFIDFEFEEGNYDAVRKLYSQLLDKTGHVKVWLSWAKAELSIGELAEEDKENAMQTAIGKARDIFSKANRELQLKEQKQPVLCLVT